MKSLAPTLVALVLLPASAALAERDPSAWDAYLDYAYVYSSAEQAALRERIDQYAGEAGIRLSDYMKKRYAAPTASEEMDELNARREGIGFLLLYLAKGEPNSLEASVTAIRRLEDRLSRHENAYWYHYILAHRALENGRRFDFVGELLDLWLSVVVPLEAPYETLQALSLSESPNSGFVSALPYVYENVSRLILIRSQEMGLDRDLDPLGAIVRMLPDDRVGAHPDVIPAELTSRQYLQRIVHRLDGAESDAGSLTFTLALFEASKYHDQARGLLANQGLDADTVKAIRVAAGAYETALNRADTLQGECAVYTRTLRQLGEVYAAKQRLGVDPDVETPFTIEGAIEVFGKLHREGARDRWADTGYVDRDQYIQALHGLWEEIQEASLNAADYYLTRAVEQPHLADEHGRSAARIYARYLAFFQQFAQSEPRDATPDSAYFAAYEAARGYGDALISYTRGNLTKAEMTLATRRYVGALSIFPFDRQLFVALTGALERQGRESEYLDLARPVAESVTKSRHVDAWIENGEPGARDIATLRRAFADSQALLYLGFAEESGVAKLEDSLSELRTRRDGAKSEFATLSDRRDRLGLTESDGGGVEALEVEELERQLADSKLLLTRLDKQIDARTRALPLYKATLDTDGLPNELRGQRDHPVHSLLRRMFHENRS